MSPCPALLFAALPPAERPTARAALARVLGDNDLDLDAAPLEALLDHHIAALDRRLATALDAILHHPALRDLEARWRALRHLVDHLPEGATVRVDLLACTRAELATDLDEAPALDRSGLHQILHARALGTYGAAPYALVTVECPLAPVHEDMVLARRLATLAALAHTVVLVDAAPALLGVTAFAELAELEDPGALRDDPRLHHLRALQRSDLARHLGVCLPRVLLRAPYRHADDPALPFRYDERTATDDDLVWGPASTFVALRAASAFARHGWCVQLLGWADGGAPVPAAPPLPALAWPPLPVPVDLLLGRRLACDLADLGFIPLVFDRARQRLALPAAPSLHAAHDGPHALADQLPYVLLITRVAHYLKAIQREAIGLWEDTPALQRHLDAWLRRHSADLPDPHPDTRARRPFRRAHLRLDDAPAHLGWIRCHLEIEPHLTHNGAPITLALVGRLDRPTPR